MFPSFLDLSRPEACERRPKDPQESYPEGSEWSSTYRTKTFLFPYSQTCGVCHPDPHAAPCDGAGWEEVESGKLLVHSQKWYKIVDFYSQPSILTPVFILLSSHIVSWTLFSCSLFSFFLLALCRRTTRERRTWWSTTRSWNKWFTLSSVTRAPCRSRAKSTPSL